MSRGSGFGVRDSMFGVGRVWLCRPAVVIVVTLAIALPAYAQTARRGGSSDPPKPDVASGFSGTSKENVNRRNPDGSTPLQWAVFNGDVAEVRRLLRAGANVSLANNYGATPMSLAAEVGNTDI